MLSCLRRKLRLFAFLSRHSREEGFFGGIGSLPGVQTQLSQGRRNRSIHLLPEGHGLSHEASRLCRSRSGANRAHSQLHRHFVMYRAHPNVPQQAWSPPRLPSRTACVRKCKSPLGRFPWQHGRQDFGMIRRLKTVPT